MRLRVPTRVTPNDRVVAVEAARLERLLARSFIRVVAARIDPLRRHERQADVHDLCDDALVRSHILAKVELIPGGWVGNTFGAEGIIGIGAGPTEGECVLTLTQTTSDYLVTNAAHWLQEMGHAGSSEAINCPEGAIQLPADIWVCKVARQTCPIQAQVFTEDPDAFLSGCLLDDERKAGILRTVAEGKYHGFHHVRGRYLCVRCAEEKGNESPFSYHYPWELTSLEDFTPCNLKSDLIDILRKVIQAGFSRASVLNALCARHSIEITQLLYPDIASKLRTLEFDVKRPTPRSRPAA